MSALPSAAAAPPPAAAPVRFRIGDWLADAAACSLERDGRRVALEPRLMEVLVVLCEFAGDVVSTEQLLIECWRGTFYGDNPVHKSIAQLRRALGDSATEPRYVATVRKRGYRLVADVAFLDENGPRRRQAATWARGAPYVGLTAFAADHREVFFGRARAQADVLAALQRRRDEDRGFVLVLGPSGCGKSSLLRAGVVPLLTQPAGFGGCRVVAVAELDPRGAAEDAIAALADALLAWRVGDEALFPRGERDLLIAALDDDAAALAARIAERLARRAPVVGRHPALLLLLDPLEQLLHAAGSVPVQPQRLFRALSGLLQGGHVLVLAACRDDFYPRIAGVPALLALKLDGGSYDLPLLDAGELAQIIRAPALAAGLRFEVDPLTSARLDDVLRDSAVRQPQPLPLLQHALLEIYHRRSGGLLTFAGYRAMGGLEGALAQRAEQAFVALPPAVQRSLPQLLRRLVALGDDGTVLARRVSWRELDEAPLRELAQALVEQRLFVAARGGGEPCVAVAHESLLRNWPRVRDWVAENRRLLLARTRLAAASARWQAEGRRRDFLLPGGSQLDDAGLLARDQQVVLDGATQAFVSASQRRHRRQRRRNAFALGLLLLCALVAVAGGVLALQARAEAERRRGEAEALVGYMLGDLTERLRGLGRLDLLDSVGTAALGYLRAQPEDAATLPLRLRASRQIGEIRFARGADDAVEAFAHALALAEQLVQRDPDDAAAWLELGNAAFWSGQAAYARSDAGTAARHWQRYREAALRLVALRPGDSRAELELSYALNNLATLDFDARRLGLARERFGESARLKRAVLQHEPAAAAVMADLADSLIWQARVEEAVPALAAAEIHQREALPLLAALRRADPDDRRWRQREALARQHLGRTRLARGDVAEAVQLFGSASDTLTELAAADASNSEWARDAFVAGLQLGTALESIDPARARVVLRATGALPLAAAQTTEPPDAPQLRLLLRLRKAQWLAATPAAHAAELDAIVAALRALPAAASASARPVLVQALLARAELAGGVAGPGAAVFAAAARDLSATQATEDVAALDARLRIAVFAGDTAAVPALRRRLAAAGYRHPDYLRFLATHLPQENPHE
jgi:DNA-binding winged helix-turn-helix (wHTH) protein